jgi:hypothetical protein
MNRHRRTRIGTSLRLLVERVLLILLKGIVDRGGQRFYINV